MSIVPADEREFHRHAALRLVFEQRRRRADRVMAARARARERSRVGDMRHNARSTRAEAAARSAASLQTRDAIDANSVVYSQSSTGQ